MGTERDHFRKYASPHPPRQSFLGPRVWFHAIHQLDLMSRYPQSPYHQQMNWTLAVKTHAGVTFFCWKLSQIAPFPTFFWYGHLLGNFTELRQMNIFCSFDQLFFCCSQFGKKKKKNIAKASPSSPLSCPLSGYFCMLYHLLLKFLSISAAFLNK